MKVLVWATSFGADLWSFTRWLDARSDVEVRVVLADPAAYTREGVAQLFPLRARLYRRNWLHQVLAAPGFRPDVTLLDNHVPMRGPSRKGFVLWHGFGWKGPNDRKEFRVLHAQLRNCFGDPLTDNPNFRWQCFGPWDFEHRTTVSGFAPSNCRIIGAASHDLLREPLDRKLAQPFYPFDVVGRKNVLFAPTWHYGEVLAHWGSDAELLEKLFTRLDQRQVNVILRLHDSFRFDPAYIQMLRGLAARHGNVLLKFKDKSPDNYLDLQIADALITNYSSIANLFYATRRPVIHVYPVRDADEAFMWRTYTVSGVRTTRVENARFIWKLPPEDNGGLIARQFDELLAQVDQALDDPRCCEAKADEFLARHMLGADGHACERAFAALEELVAAR